MKKVICSLAALLCYGLGVSATAAPAPATNVTAPTRIGILDVQQVVERSIEIPQIRKKLETTFESERHKLEEATTKYKHDLERLNRDDAIMSNNDRKQLSQTIMTEAQSLQTMQNNLRQAVFAAQNKEFKVFLDKIKLIAAKIASADNLSVVITKDFVAYANPDLDITGKVIQQIPHK